jgi:hypothetical protein
LVAEALFHSLDDFVVFEQLTVAGSGPAPLDLLMEPSFMIQVSLDCRGSHGGFGFLAPRRHLFQQPFLLTRKGNFHVPSV